MSIKIWFARLTIAGRLALLAVIVIVIVGVAIVFVLNIFQLEIHLINSTQNVSNLTGTPTQPDSPISFDSSAMATIIATVLTGSVTAFFAPVLKARFDREGVFTSGYTKWCIQLHGAVFEFSELCSEIKKHPSPPRSVLPDAGHTNPTYVISHLWEMHKAVEGGYKWLGMLWQDDPYTYSKFNKLFDKVDYLWHYLENEFEPDFYGKQATSDDLRDILKILSYSKRILIAERIRYFIVDESDFNADKFEAIKQFLDNKIPTARSRYFIRPEPLRPIATIIFPEDDSVVKAFKVVSGNIVGDLSITTIKLMVDDGTFDVSVKDGKWEFELDTFLCPGLHTITTLILNAKKREGRQTVKFRVV